MSELVFTCTQLGQIPVHHAAFGGHLEVVKYLLELQPKTVSAEDNVSRAIFGHECITQACATLANDRLHSVIFRGVRWVHPPLPQLFWPWCKKHQSAARAANGGRLASKSCTYGTRCVNYTVKETIDCVNLHRCTDSRTRSMLVETLDHVQWCAARSAVLVLQKQSFSSASASFWH